MAKAQITFDLNEHDDRMDMARYNASLDMALFIWEVLYNGRRKFENEGNIHDVFDWLWEEARNRNIIIDNLIE